MQPDRPSHPPTCPPTPHPPTCPHRQPWGLLSSCAVTVGLLIWLRFTRSKSRSCIPTHLPPPPSPCLYSYFAPLHYPRPPTPYLAEALLPHALPCPGCAFPVRAPPPQLPQADERPVRQQRAQQQAVPRLQGQTRGRGQHDGGQPVWGDMAKASSSGVRLRALGTCQASNTTLAPSPLSDSLAGLVARGLPHRAKPHGPGPGPPPVPTHEEPVLPQHAMRVRQQLGDERPGVGGVGGTRKQLRE